MALHASAFNKGALVAAICVALVVSWVVEPAQGSPSCAVRRCISECPSKCDETQVADACQMAKAVYVKCRPNCMDACTQSCRSGSFSCDTCDSTCDSNCRSSANDAYNSCVSGMSQQCKDSCEKRCKGENSE